MAIILAGGDGVKATEIFDFTKNEWSFGPDLPYEISNAAIVQWNDTFIMVGGKNEAGNLKTLWKFDVLDQKWQLMDEPLPTPRYKHTAFLVPDEYCQTEQ